MAATNHEKEENRNTEVFAEGHGPGCAVPDTKCAKTLIGRSALARHVAVTGVRLRWLSDIAPVKFKVFDDSTQQTDGAVMLHRRIG